MGGPEANGISTGDDPLVDSERPRERRRFLGRMRAFGGFAVSLWRVPVWLLSKPGSALARRLEHGFFDSIVRDFGLDVDIHGQALPGALIVTNHISWAEIAALAARVDADFVAKAEVGRWPVVGPLARRFGVILVARERRTQSGDQADSIRARLEAGRSVILFPEGTTSDGTGVLPFRTSLFAAAEGAHAVQPAVIRYTYPDGTPLSPLRQREVAWIGDDDLLGGAIRVARERTRLEIIFLDPIDPRQFPDRKALADAARSAIVSAYAAAPNRPR